MSRIRISIVHVVLLALLCPLGVQASDGDAGPDQYICATQTILAASVLTQGETGTWAVVAGTATFLPLNSPGSFVTGLAVGENTLQWTVFLNGSPVSSDQVTITVYDPSAAPANAGPDVTICIDQPSTLLQAAPVALPVLGNWTVTSGNATIASPSQAQTMVTCSGLGPVSLLWTVFNGPCGESSDPLVIHVEDCQTGVGQHAAQDAVLRLDAGARMVNITGAVTGTRALLMDAVGKRLAVFSVGAAGDLQVSLAALPGGWYALRLECHSSSQLLRFLVAE